MKAIVALVAILAVASAADMCMPTLFMNLPMLQPVYTDIKAKNWLALQEDLAKFIPAAKNILKECADVNVDSPRVQACVDDAVKISALIVPVAVNPQNKSAIGEMAVELPITMNHLYTTCLAPASNTTEAINFLEEEDLIAFGFFDSIKKGFEKAVDKVKDVAGTVADKIVDVAGDVKDGLSKAFDKVGDIAKEVAKNAVTCVPKVISVVPTFKNFVDHVEQKAQFEVIHGDIKAIFGNINGLCDACGIPKPTTANGQAVDVQKCALAAVELAPVLKSVVESNGDQMKMMEGVIKVVSSMPVVIPACGISL